jgi:hypothetical protein
MDGWGGPGDTVASIVAEEKPADREEAPRQSATRIWLVAATITATLLAAVGTVAYYRYAAALARSATLRQGSAASLDVPWAASMSCALA